MLNLGKKRENDPIEDYQRLVESAFKKARSSLDNKRRRSIGDELAGRRQEGSAILHHERSTQLTKQFLRSILLPDVLVVERAMGPILSSGKQHGDFEQPGVVNPLELAIYVGLCAVEHLNYTEEWKHWSGKGPSQDLHTMWEQTWLTTMFRLAISLPLGYLVSHTTVSGTNPLFESPEPWSPCMEDMTIFMKRCDNIQVKRSNRVLSPRQIAFSSYKRLFESSSYEIPMLSLAEADFFADYPNTDNPFYSAINAALKFVFEGREYDLCFPYWWVLLLNQHFLRYDGFKPIQCIVDERCRPKFTDTGGVAYDDEPVKSEPVVDEVPPPGPIPDIAGPTLPASILVAINDGLRTGDFLVNGKGAVFHKVAGHFYIVCPLFFKLVAETFNRPDISAEYIESQFAENSFLETKNIINDFEIRPGGVGRRAGKVTAKQLSVLGAETIFPDGDRIPNNPDLVPLLRQDVA